MNRTLASQLLAAASKKTPSRTAEEFPMTMIRKLVPAQIKALGEDEVEVRMSTATIARDGHILIPQGGKFENYKKNPVVLWNHDTDDFPVGRSEQITVEADEIVSRVRFPPMGISPRADTCRGLAKTGFLNGVSVGFDPEDGEPLDPRNPRGGMRITDWDLIELSFCCVPVDTDALVTSRALNLGDLKCAVSRELPIEDSDASDGAASIFEWAGGDDFDPTRARKGFLVYDAAKPKQRSSYQFPIAHVVDGRLKVPKGAIRAAASQLSKTDLPDDIRTAAESVIHHYQERAGMADTNVERSVIKTKHTRALDRSTKTAIVKRGLYQVSRLACMLEEFGYAHSASEWEAEIEGDDSPVPAMLGAALVKFGEAFIAMTKEEVTELLAAKDLEIDEEAIVVEERAYVAAAKTPATRAWRAGVAMARAGKALSASNQEKLAKVDKSHAQALKNHKALGEHHAELGGNMDAITEQQSKASEAHGELGEALQDAKKEPEKATEHVTRALKAHKALGGAIGDMSDQASSMKDTHADAGDAHEAVGRHLKAAQRCMRSVVEGATTGAENKDGDSTDVQTSAGTEESDGSKNARSLDLTNRKRDLESLAGIARSYA
jgi:HK97 family phage prohead protease